MPKYQPPIKMLQEPVLRQPYLVAAGPGTANVGLRTIDYLRQQLAAECFAQIEPEEFFTAPYSFVIEEGVVKLNSLGLEKEKPQNNFYYYRSGKAHDLVLFVGDTQPLPGKGLELARTVMGVAAALGITRLFVAGAFVTEIHHKEEPQVLALVSKKESLEPLQKLGIQPAPPITAAYNMITWLVSAAIEKNIDVACLVAPMPFYAAEEGNARACRALVRVLGKVLEVERNIDLAPLEQLVARDEARIDAMINELRSSPDERARAFLEYVEMLERNRQLPPVQGVAQPRSLPQSLKFIGDLYQEAKRDKSKVSSLAYELGKLSHLDRLEVLRALGPELLELMGGEIG